MNKPRIVIFGGGNQASYVIDIIEKAGLYDLIGIIDSKKEIGSKVFDYPVIGRQESVSELIELFNIEGGIVSIGDNYSRYLVVSQIRQLAPEFNFVNAIHPNISIGNNARLGVGIVAMSGVIFNTNIIVGDFTFFATGCQIEHDCKIDCYASVSAGTVLGGRVELGGFSAITLGVTVIDRVKIGENTVVGAGSLVLKDLPSNVLAYGNPCKIIRSRLISEKFLK